MASGEIDRLPVNELPRRYSLARSAVYKRIKDLGIEPVKVGNRAYVTAPQIRLLDQVHEFIRTGGTMAEFLEMRGIQTADDDYFDSSSGLSTIQPNDIIDLVSKIAAEMAARLQPSQNVNPLDYYQVLEQASACGWKLKTSEVAALLGMKDSEVTQHGDRFSEAGFVFTRSGRRSGGEAAWRVSKR
ncbi:MAG: hypothetical protein HC886_07755 [Leptolyngbyaceae cyanobacterium SM1_1_3]|nr:hypothetical protein [Leptolyngbyaceae cyanobacterium SM1_1_3]NJN04968.1 hypothetical protein [Leptolyngbyaceae cyanobacterium RM1_1_2]NJO10161.1 hypothetical protein [Leptolyngbyaceae cyanobacterium SL_1_1]